MNLRNPATQQSKGLRSLEFRPSAAARETQPVDLRSLLCGGHVKNEDIILTA